MFLYCFSLLHKAVYNKISKLKKPDILKTTAQLNSIGIKSGKNPSKHCSCTLPHELKKISPF